MPWVAPLSHGHEFPICAKESFLFWTLPAGERFRSHHAVTLLLVFVLLLPLVGHSAVFAQPATGQAGTATAQEEPASRSPQGFFEIVFSGGVTGISIMVALIALSLTAGYLVFEHALTLRRRAILPDGLADSVRQLVGGGKFAEAAQLCREQPSLLSFVLLQGVEEVEGGWNAVEKGMEEALAEQTARLFRKIEYLSVIGNIAPMLGLLGTVTGMIFCFERVAATGGSAGAPELAEGIYQALVTTVAGLVIAIPSLGAFAIFRNRVDEFAAQGAYLAQHAMSPLKQQRMRPARVTQPPPPPPGGR